MPTVAINVVEGSPAPIALPSAWWPRLQLIEWHEQAWLPDVLRRAMTDYLAAIIDVANPLGPLVPRLADLCARNGADRSSIWVPAAGGHGCASTTISLPSCAGRCG